MGEWQSAVAGGGLSFWSGRSVFVTGASGLLGSALTEELIQRGAVVTCLMRDWTPSSRLVQPGLLTQVNIVQGSLEDYPLLLRALNEYEVDTVFHLGAQTIVGTASRSPLSTFEANVRGTWNLLEACRVCPQLVRRVIVASSDKAYGSHATLPYTEAAPLQGRYPYDVSKACADLIAQSFYHAYRVPLAVTRCGNLFGPGDLNFNRLIPGAVRAALRGEAPLIRSDGRYVRDYFFVKDAADAYLLLAERLYDDGVLGEAFNFGTETPLTVLDVVQLILRMTGRQHLTPIILNEVNGEIPRQYLDCAKARRLLGWRPRYSLEEGLHATIAWYERQLAYAAE